MSTKKIAVAALAATLTLGATGMSVVHAADHDGGSTGTTVVPRTRTTLSAEEQAEREAREAQRTADFAALATLLNLDATTLESRLKGGETLKQVAEAQGVNVQAVIDLMVSQATTRMRAEITDKVNNGKSARDGRGPGRRGPGGSRGRESSGQAPSATQSTQR